MNSPSLFQLDVDDRTGQCGRRRLPQAIRNPPASRTRWPACDMECATEITMDGTEGWASSSVRRTPWLQDAPPGRALRRCSSLPASPRRSLRPAQRDVTHYTCKHHPPFIDPHQAASENSGAAPPSHGAASGASKSVEPFRTALILKWNRDAGRGASCAAGPV